VALRLEEREVWVRGWLYVVQGQGGGRTPVVLLDTDLAQNHPDDRGITDVLYGDGPAYRLKQEAVLGIGGVRMLRALGFAVRHYHMNEGHSALLTVELLLHCRYAPADLRPDEPRYDVPRMRKMCNFTTHTPVEAGHDRFSYELVARILDEDIDVPLLQHYAGATELNMTRLALELSDYVNGVARSHAEVSSRMFPGHEVHAITNGVHPLQWTAPEFSSLYDECLPGWCHEPEILARAERIDDQRVVAAHRACRERLLALVRARAGVTLDPAAATIGFARRMTGYKRPELLFSGIERLLAIARHLPFQVVLAGKAHPQDEGGKRAIEALHRHVDALRGTVPVVFIPNYDMDVARAMVAGCDVWLNTPLPPLEASGTSGMKAAFNGVPQLSVLDGWWIEGWIEGITGWAIDSKPDAGPEGAAESLYAKLENTILPLWHADSGRSAGWTSVMKGAICRNAAYFQSQRMMRRYATEVYLR
jgi:glycogen phosphorylase